MRPVIAALVFVLAVIAADAGATVLYKLVDPLGRITYTDMVPRAFDGTITRIEVDTNAMAIAPERIPEVLLQPPAESVLLARRLPADDERLRTAHERVESARAALQSARDNSPAEDWIYVGPNNPLGMRRMPRPEYGERLQRLELDVIDAENALDALQRNLR